MFLFGFLETGGAPGQESVLASQLDRDVLIARQKSPTAVIILNAGMNVSVRR
jgi:hypothetical protein